MTNVRPCVLAALAAVGGACSCLAAEGVAVPRKGSPAGVRTASVVVVLAKKLV